MMESAALPPLYQGWVDSLLGAPIPAEHAATCDDCAMLPARDLSPAAEPKPDDTGQFFHPSIKCCTYLPEIPNYLVGRILENDDPDSAATTGRASVQRRLDAGVAVSPLGLGRAPVHALLYHHGAQAFGKSVALRCPHYIEDGGRCGVWQNRAAVCATWFCKYDRGAVGMGFWRALHQLLAALESNLSRMCVHALGIGEEALRALFPTAAPGGPKSPALDANAIDGVTDPRWQKRIWGDWLGREEAFYGAAAAHVAALSFETILAVCGPEVRIFADLTRAAHRQLLSQELPPALHTGPFRLVQIGKKIDRVVSYNAYDPLDLPAALVRVLPYFDGRPTVEALESILTEEKIRVAPQAVRQLVDFGILLP